jgi:hypothetical protein
MARFNPAGCFPPLDQVGNLYVNPQLGVTTTTVAAAAGTTVILAAPGRLCRVLVTGAGSGSGNVTFFDNATTGTGTVIGVLPATVSVTGIPFDFQFPAANGITVTNVASGPALTVSYH